MAGSVGDIPFKVHVNPTSVHPQVEQYRSTHYEMNKVRYPNIHLRTPKTKGMLLDVIDNATLTKTIVVSKKSVEQPGYLKDVDSLVVLSGTFIPPPGSAGIE